MSKNTKLILLALVVAAFTIPVWRSGGKTNLTFFGFIKNHSIFADTKEPEYIPKESYSEIFN